MKQNLAKALKMGPAQVNVKATTTEKLGFTGRDGRRDRLRESEDA